jgi:hypothetical protein
MQDMSDNNVNIREECQVVQMEVQSVLDTRHLYKFLKRRDAPKTSKTDVKRLLSFGVDLLFFAL